jgi:anaerobic selenocysteine-containing dehydrogenase
MANRSAASDATALIGEAICPYCGVGCRLWMEAAYGEILRVKGCTDAAANRGGICAKGATLPQVLATPDRLLQPQARATRSESLRPLSWQQAIGFAAARLREIIARHGADAVAFYGSGQLDTETVYLAGKLFKGSLGTNNTDSNSRLCMAAAVMGYRTSLGSDGPPTCYDDIDEADLIVVVGSNMAEAHPVTFDRIRERRRGSGGRPRLIVIDPRRTATAAAADLHVPVAPGGDIALFNLVARRLIAQGAIDREFVEGHTRGHEELAGYLERVDEAELLAASGLATDVIAQMADSIAAAGAWLSFYCMGLGQSTVGMWKHNALINLHLLTGQIGKAGAGPFSLTGQPNAMGGREAGLLAQQLPGYRLVEDASHRAEAERHWGLSPGAISPRPGLTAIEMFRALESGKLKAIWIAGTNPAVSLPDLHHVRRALTNAELVIVQDPYHPTETSQFADVLLPVAQFGEKEWTSTNSERMVALSERVVDPPGAARSDWEVVASMARELGCSGFDYATRDDVWDEFIALTRQRPCDMSGITAARLRAEKSLQWPCPEETHPGTRRRYLERRFPTGDGRAVLLARSHRPPRETADHEFPFVLTTGRLYTHWHTLTRTGKSAKLMAREPSPFVEIHPDDASQLGAGDGQMLQLTSRRGTIRLPARLNDGLRRGLLFAPFHWGDLWGRQTAPNYLTISAIGRVAKQPELKFCAVQVEAIGPDGQRPDSTPCDLSTNWIERLQRTIGRKS